MPTADENTSWFVPAKCAQVRKLEISNRRRPRREEIKSYHPSSFPYLGIDTVWEQCEKKERQERPPGKRSPTKQIKQWRPGRTTTANQCDLFPPLLFLLPIPLPIHFLTPSSHPRLPTRYIGQVDYGATPEQLGEHSRRPGPSPGTTIPTTRCGRKLRLPGIRNRRGTGGGHRNTGQHRL